MAGGNHMLNINKTSEEKTVVLALEGRLDTMTSPQLEAELFKDMPQAQELIFDFTKLEYISSAGLRILLTANKTMAPKGGMKVVNASEIVKEVFDVTGFSDILTIE